MTNQSEEVYVVLRDGRRVSHTNHATKAEAMEEARWWTGVINKVINGRKVDPRSIIRIVKTDTPRKFR